MCGGPKQVWGDQKAGAPENLLALRAEGTRVSSWPSNVRDKTIQEAPRGRQNWTCSRKLRVSNWHCRYNIPIYVICCICRNLRAFWGDQTDPKHVCGGPNSILRIKILDFLYWRVVLVKAQLVALLLRLSDTLKSIIRFKLTWGKNYLGNAENVIFRGPGVSILPS